MLSAVIRSHDHTPSVGGLRCGGQPIMIGIGGTIAHPPLPHHRTYGSVYGGSNQLSFRPAANKKSPSEAVPRWAEQTTWPDSDSDAMALDCYRPCSLPSQVSRRVSPVPHTACGWFSTAARKR